MIAEFISYCINNFICFALQIKSAGSFPRPLTAKKEAEYLERSQKGDEEARAKLIEHNLRLVAHVIKKYYGTGYDQDDLISIGTIGLIKGISTFNGDKGTRLATYAARCIENEVLMHFRQQKKSAQDVYISDPIDTDKDGNTLSLMDIICDESNLIDDIDLKLRAQQLYKYINACLSPREKQIIEMRYGLCGNTPITQREVAAKLNISRSYVSRIEKKALGELRNKFEENEK